MTPRDRLAVGLLMMARNPVGTILFLIAGAFLLVPFGLVFLAVYLLIKLLEVLLAKKPAAPAAPRQLEAWQQALLTERPAQEEEW